MMTPKAVFNFTYELRLIKGNSIRSERKYLKNGAFEAIQWLEAHGVNISYTTALNSFQGRMYAINKLPYYDINSEHQLIQVINQMHHRTDIVDVHIYFNRTA